MISLIIIANLLYALVIETSRRFFYIEPNTQNEACVQRLFQFWHVPAYRIARNSSASTATVSMMSTSVCSDEMKNRSRAAFSGTAG